MIELTFRLTSNDGNSRDIVVCIHQPFRNPPAMEWPWAIVVDVDGRPYTTYGVDPLDAIKNASQHAAILLGEGYDGSLDPPVEPRSK